LLQGVGYEIRLIEDHPASHLEELLEGVKLLLVAPSLNPSGGASESTVVNIRDELDRAAAPVLTLSTAAKEALAEQPGFILWPCRLEDLSAKIEAALFPAPEVEEAS
jgi:hypothetical protein